MVRILVEQSSYGLLNLGDRAMLEAGIGHIYRIWPKADIAIVSTVDPSSLFHGTRQVPPFVDLQRLGLDGYLARGAQAALKQYLPFAAGRSQHLDRQALSRSALVSEISKADLVISTGGGFINDDFHFHANGVLSVLRTAQRLGLVTAMFGQGIGPLRHRWSIRQAATVLPNLSVLGLRAPGLGPLLPDMMRAGNWHVTGDDALVVAIADSSCAMGNAVGLNVRASAYARIGITEMHQLRCTIRDIQHMLGANIIPLPVVINQHDSDLEAIAKVTQDTYDTGDIQTTADLAVAISGCRIVITGSYHAAVFGLARGIPIVGLSRSSYYTRKFRGLAMLFPRGSVSTIVMHGEHWQEELLKATIRGWNSDAMLRESMVVAASDMATRSTSLWNRFGDIVSTQKVA